MADMITALEGRGLIERHRDQADRRRLVVALTMAGRHLLDDYRRPGRRAGSGDAHGPVRRGVSGLRHSLHALHANLAGRA